MFHIVFYRIVTAENADSDVITARVTSHVQDVTIERDTIKEIDYNLPSKDIDKFAGKFHKTLFLILLNFLHYFYNTGGVYLHSFSTRAK